MQGGIYELPIPPFKTGLIRGRFNPGDGHLYVCGMSAWATNQVFEQGGFFRIRYNGKPIHAPIDIRATERGVYVTFSDKLDKASVEQSDNFQVETWELKRTRRYGSDHYNEKKLKIGSSQLLGDQQTVFLELPTIEPVWQMEIRWDIKGNRGEKVEGRIQNTIHQLGKDAQRVAISIN